MSPAVGEGLAVPQAPARKTAQSSVSNRLRFTAPSSAKCSASRRYAETVTEYAPMPAVSTLESWSKHPNEGSDALAMRITLARWTNDGNLANRPESGSWVSLEVSSFRCLVDW